MVGIFFDEDSCDFSTANFLTALLILTIILLSCCLTCSTVALIHTFTSKNQYSNDKQSRKEYFRRYPGHQ